MTLEKKPFENIVGKGENGGNVFNPIEIKLHHSSHKLRIFC